MRIEIPGPGYGPPEGAVDIPGPVSPDTAAAPQIPRCATCRWFAPLSPGRAAICHEKWRDLPWNAGVPLTTATDSCERHEDVG